MAEVSVLDKRTYSPSTSAYSCLSQRCHKANTGFCRSLKITKRISRANSRIYPIWL